MILQIINGMSTCFVGHTEIVAALRAARFPPHSKLWGTQRNFSWIQNFLGHESYQTTMDMYGTLSIDEMQEVAERLLD